MLTRLVLRLRDDIPSMWIRLLRRAPDWNQSPCCVWRQFHQRL